MQNNHNFDDSDYSMEAFLNLHKKDFSRLDDEFTNKKTENPFKVNEIKKTQNPYESIK
jgi:hypothetical protein